MEEPIWKVSTVDLGLITRTDPSPHDHYESILSLGCGLR